MARVRNDAQMKKIATHVVSVLALACQAALAQPADSVKSAVQRAISTNPEVTAKLNALRASTAEVDVARGGYYPKLDLSAEVGRTRDRFKDEANRATEPQNMTNTGLSLSATQLLWDGLGTVNEVSRLGHARLVRYYEFLEASEQTALETVKAHVDVQRAAKLVKLAEDNYVQHRQVLDQIQSRVKAGVGRGVDSEQAAARLALAESNLTTETANLHDVTERYRRLVGIAPTVDGSLPGIFDRGLPASTSALLDQTSKRNYSVAAAVENLRAAQNQAEQRKSAFHPRIEARARTGGGRNYDITANQQRETHVGLMLNWNLFNGGSDKARIKQTAALLDQAADTRDKACRDTRQTAAIAMNDVKRLTEQLGYLDRNTLASERTRDAYRQQFDIGQRSLLDVLNSENELYTARRALANGEHDLVISKARTHAATSNLVNVLGLTRAGEASDDPTGGQSWEAGEDAAARCPLNPTELNLASKSDLDQRARQTAAGAPSLSPKPAVAAPVAPAATAAEPAVATSVSQRLIDWADAWKTKDTTRYVSFYDAKFQPIGTTRKAWFAARNKALSQGVGSDLKVSNVQRRSLPNGQIETSFDQTSTVAGKTTTIPKTLTWARRGVEWYIVKETNSR